MGFSGLCNKVAIVTGAAGGIGLATVQRLAKEGTKVVAVDLRASEMAGLAEEHGDAVAILPADVATADGCESYVKAAVERFGAVQFLVNTAAVLGERASLVDLDVAEFDRVWAVNVRSVFLGLKMVIRKLLQQGFGGAIVNLSSIAGLRGHPNNSHYGATKHAVIGLSKVAAVEYGRYGIRVNAICPGPVDTPMLRPALGLDEADLPQHLAKNPIPRAADPREIANFIAYLLSDEASYQTGGVYTIDGGLSAR
jgi:NAD(P)-dependent dehydrogenase (short-subunit alcohol dehydrogenase family)